MADEKGKGSAGRGREVDQSLRKSTNDALPSKGGQWLPGKRPSEDASIQYSPGGLECFDGAGNLNTPKRSSAPKPAVPQDTKKPEQ